MNGSTKTILTLVALVAVLGGGSLAYNYLAPQFTPESNLTSGDSLGIVSTAQDRLDEAQQASPEPTDVPPTEEPPEPTGLPPSEEPAPEEPETIPAPDFPVLDVEGNEVMLSDYFGKPMVLNFWASWCPPCQAEMPHFEAAYQELGEDVQFFMVDLVDGSRETVEVGQQFIDDAGYTFPIFFDTSGISSYYYGLQSIPSTFFLDAEGNVVYGVRGGLSAEALQAGIDEIYAPE